MDEKRRLTLATIILLAALTMNLAVPLPACAAGETPAAEGLQDIAKEIVGWGVAITACCVALAIALGGLEGQLGEMFQIPGFRASMQVRIVACILALVIAVSAIPITNAVVDAMSSAGMF